MDGITQIAKNSQLASKQLRVASTKTKNLVLQEIANNINNNRNNILIANNKDIANAKQNNISLALIDRLTINDNRIDAIITSLEQIIQLNDPINEISQLSYKSSGIKVGKMRTPIGVIGIIYESRPNVTIDAASLCLKSGNASILRGGKEAINSNIALYECVKNSLIKNKLSEYCVQLIVNTDRKLVNDMISAKGLIDVIIPRGGKGLIASIADNAKVPIIKHLNGVCHVYIDKYADTEKAINIAINAKTRRYGVCNAMETLLIHKDIASKVLAQLITQYQQKGVQLRGCIQTQKFADDIIPATEDDWYEEYLAPILAIKIVSSTDEAIAHIDKYGSGHTEAIVSENNHNAKKFLNQVDSSSVMLNASTAFADGFEYGLGAEIGISTDKLHVRGPVGLEGLTSQKYVVFGKGHIRD